MDGSKVTRELPVEDALLRTEADTVQLDWDALGRHLRHSGLDVSGSWAPRQFSGGYGNLNYLMRINDTWAVLRRPPFGHIPRGANDMAREHRVLSVLAPAWDLAPAAMHFTDDINVIGAPFLISEFKAGKPLHGTEPLDRSLTEAEAKNLSALQVSILAQLHALDIKAIGASHLGRQEDFAGRTLRGWLSRLEGASSSVPKEARQLFDWLSAASPRDERRSVIHNDFKLDNVIVDPVSLKPRAVLDWDMSTLGSPFFDLATLLTYWISPSDPEGLQGINLTHSQSSGALSRRELVDLYLSASGYDSKREEDELCFFVGLAFAKLGVVCMQLYDRFLHDPDGHQRNEKFGPAIPAAFETGLAAVSRELF